MFRPLVHKLSKLCSNNCVLLVLVWDLPTELFSSPLFMQSIPRLVPPPSLTPSFSPSFCDLMWNLNCLNWPAESSHTKLIYYVFVYWFNIFTEDFLLFKLKSCIVTVFTVQFIYAVGQDLLLNSNKNCMHFTTCLYKSKLQISVLVWLGLRLQP